MHSNYIIPTHSQSFALYRRRWYMLAVVVMFNISNAMIWLTFAPVANYSASYFNVSETTVNYFSLVFFIAFIPFCVFSWWVIETYGFRFAVICGTAINAVGAVIRVVGAYCLVDPKGKFILVLCGQILASTTQPLVLSMPTKLAALWFGDHERTVANTIASMANPLGALLANAFATVIVKNSSDISLMLTLFGIPALMAALMAVTGFHSSKPPTAPSPSALEEPASFFDGFKQILHNKQFLLLTVVSGGGIAAFSVLSTVIQQLICPQGYDDVIASISGALLVATGFVGAGITGVYIDKTRNYIDLAKILSLLFALSSVAIIITSSIRNQPVLLVLAFALSGFTALGLLPVMLELGVECTYPVDEATSSGMQWALGQLLGAIMLVGGLAAAPPLTAEETKQSVCVVNNKSSLKPVNLTNPVIAMICFCVACCILFIAFFDTPYKRLNKEKEQQTSPNGNEDLFRDRDEVPTRAECDDTGTVII